MKDPDWYGEWRREAIDQLHEKNDRLMGEFRLGRWSGYHYDLDAGTLIHSDAGVPKVIAEIQVVGTTSPVAANWMWAWANGHWPAERVTHAERVRAFGEQHGIGELVRDYVGGAGDLNTLGWDLSAVAARVTEALGVYRPRTRQGDLYLLYKSILWVS